jgi:hypothetical protein
MDFFRLLRRFFWEISVFSMDWLAPWCLAMFYIFDFDFLFGKYK